MNRNGEARRLPRAEKHSTSSPAAALHWRAITFAPPWNPAACRLWWHRRCSCERHQPASRHRPASAMLPLRQRTIHPQIDGRSVIVLLFSYAIRKLNNKGGGGVDNCSPYGMVCSECNDSLIAPRWSAYVSKHEVRHFWSCENYGHEIEMMVNPRMNAASKLSL